MDTLSLGRNPYPHKFHVSVSLPEYVRQYSGLEKGEQLKDTKVSVAGARCAATASMHGAGCEYSHRARCTVPSVLVQPLTLYFTEGRAQPAHHATKGGYSDTTTTMWSQMGG